MLKMTSEEKMFKEKVDVILEYIVKTKNSILKKIVDFSQSTK